LPAWKEAVPVTQEYLIGEFSIRLEMLQAASVPDDAEGVTRLRREVEGRPLGWLAPAMVRALALADGLCWDSLSRGDLDAFDRRARICAELRDFGISACLLSDDRTGPPG
jgi:hypothetical protein